MLDGNTGSLNECPKKFIEVSASALEFNSEYFGIKNISS
jgi:hypothetical protein